MTNQSQTEVTEPDRESTINFCLRDKSEFCVLAIIRWHTENRETPLFNSSCGIVQKVHSWATGALNSDLVLNQFSNELVSEQYLRGSG